MTDESAAGGRMGQQVGSVIDEIRPALQSHGGDIELVAVDEDTGVVSVRLQGACQGCPGAAMTLRIGVERQLRQRVPGITEVRAVE